MFKKIAFFFGVIVVSVLLYARFQNYEPKILKRLAEIRGIATQRDTLPYPLNSIKISETRTPYVEHTTLKTTATHEKITAFYKNILMEKGWKIEEEEINENFSTIKFKKDKEVINIVSSKEPEKGYTVFSVEIVTP